MNQIWNKVKRAIKNTLVVLLAISMVNVYGQDIDARSPRPRGSSKQQQKADKKKAKQQANLAKGIEKGKKRHMKLQEKQTRKMMKKSKRKANRWNQNKKEFFLKRWFRKGRR